MKHLILNPALEAISFQPTSFFNELTLCYEALRKVPAKDLPEHEMVSTINKTVKRFTGLSVVLEIGSHDPAIQLPPMNKNNVLINNMRRNFLSSNDGISMIENSDKVVSGYVDLKRSMVSGVFSDVSAPIYMPAKMFTGTQDTSEEMAAVMIHEIGHFFTLFEHFSMTATTNQCLAGIARSLDGTEVQYRISALAAARKKFNLKDFDENVLAKQDSKVVEVAFISSMAQESTSVLGRNVYDMSSFEYLSDQFVARHGASRHLATALSKIYAGSYNISYRGTIGYLTIEAIKIALFCYLPHLSVMLMAMDGQGDGTYDVPGARLKRVRNQVLEALKDTGLSKAEVEELTADKIAIDECMAQFDDRRQLIGVLYDFLWPGANKDRKFKKLQQDLEDLAANELFAKAAEWRTLK